MGLRDRLNKLQRTTERDTTVLLCPECGEEFRVHEDTPLDYVVSEWTKATGEKGYWTAPPDLLRLEAHAHDPSAFLDKATGSPWLGQFFHGTRRMQEEVEGGA